jgi:DNA-binding beta-propeller fold protein YncE
MTVRVTGVSVFLHAIVVIGLVSAVVSACMPAGASEPAQGNGAPHRIEVVAGGGTAVEGRPATECRVTQPFGIAFDPHDNMFICEETHRVLRVDARTGLLSVVTPARPATEPLGDGGPAANARFAAPHCLVADGKGNLFLADTGNHRVRRIDAESGVVTTVAGTGIKELSGDGGPAVNAGLDGIACLCFGPGFSRLYIGGFSRVIRGVDMQRGTIETVPGTGGNRAFAVDAAGRLYTPTARGVRQLAPDGTSTLLEDPSADPPMKAVKHLWPDHDGNILIADDGTDLIRRFVVQERRLVRVAGTGRRGAAGVPGDPLAAELAGPHGVVVHPRTQDIYIADSRNHRVLRISATPTAGK